MSQPAINPLFEKRLPVIIESLLETLDVIREPLAEANTLVRELQEYLDFEIGKAHLAIDLGEGERSDHLQWASRLEFARAIMAPGDTDLPLKCLTNLVENLQENIVLVEA